MTTISVDLVGSANPVEAEILPAVKAWLAPSETISSSAAQHIVCVIASACVMRHIGSQPEILLLQRHRTDSWPLLWEIPGGCAELTDPSLIHSAIRELFEETGLRARRILSTVTMGAQLPSSDVAAHAEEDAEMDAGSGLCTFVESKRTWGKVVFLIDVSDALSITITEHEAYRWVTEEELRAACVGEAGNDDGKLRMISKSNKRTFLEAFRLAGELGRAHLGHATRDEDDTTGSR